MSGATGLSLALGYTGGIRAPSTAEIPFIARAASTQALAYDGPHYLGAMRGIDAIAFGVPVDGAVDATAALTAADALATELGGLPIWLARGAVTIATSITLANPIILGPGARIASGNLLAPNYRRVQTTLAGSPQTIDTLPEGNGAWAVSLRHVGTSTWQMLTVFPKVGAQSAVDGPDNLSGDTVFSVAAAGSDCAIVCTYTTATGYVVAESELLVVA